MLIIPSMTLLSYCCPNRRNITLNCIYRVILFLHVNFLFAYRATWSYAGTHKSFCQNLFLSLLTQFCRQIEENTRVLEKLGQRGSTAPGYASRSVFNMVIIFFFNINIIVSNIIIVVAVMMIVSARMTTVLCAREASAGKLRSAGRLEPRRLCFSGSKPRLGLKSSLKRSILLMTLSLWRRWASSLVCKWTTSDQAGETEMPSLPLSTASDRVISTLVTSWDYFGDWLTLLKTASNWEI